MSTSRPPVQVGAIWSKTSRAVAKTIVCSRKRRARSSRSISEMRLTSGLPSTTGASWARVAVSEASSRSTGTLVQSSAEARHPGVLHAHHVRPGDLERAPLGQRLDPRLGRRWRRDDVVAPLVGQEGEGNAEDVDVLGREEPGRRIQLVGRAAQASPHHLLAQELAGERPQPHDVGHRARVPALGEHAHRDDVLDALAGLPRLADGIHLHAQPLGLFLPGQPARRALLALAGVSSSSGAPPPSTASASSRASACSSTFESMCSVRSGAASSSMRMLPRTNAW